VTIVHVTHDIDEAVYLADRVLVFSRAPGRVVGSIDVSLSRPRSQRVTRSSPAFLGLRAEIHALIGSQQALR
jgi:ABC-type nitrate/sulfonate/bicarbonate transport system ATPase subunit